MSRSFLLLPVELFDQNGQTSTNWAYFTDLYCKASTIGDIFLSTTPTCGRQNPIRFFSKPVIFSTILYANASV
jgi:hypothetical protein